MLDIRFLVEPESGCRYRCSPVYGHLTHERRHGKHMSMAGAVSAKRNQRYRFRLASNHKLPPARRIH